MGTNSLIELFKVHKGSLNEYKFEINLSSIRCIYFI